MFILYTRNFFSTIEMNFQFSNTGDCTTSLKKSKWQIYHLKCKVCKFL